MQITIVTELNSQQTDYNAMVIAGMQENYFFLDKKECVPRKPICVNENMI